MGHVGKQAYLGLVRRAKCLLKKVAIARVDVGDMPPTGPGHFEILYAAQARTCAFVLKSQLRGLIICLNICLRYALHMVAAVYFFNQRCIAV